MIFTTAEPYVEIEKDNDNNWYIQILPMFGEMVTILHGNSKGELIFKLEAFIQQLKDIKTLYLNIDN